MRQVTSKEAVASPSKPGPRESRPPPASNRRPLAARLALAQGAFLLLTGAWPIVSLRSFEKVTGPKREGWLVKTVGACIANAGAALAIAGARGKVSRELRMLGVGLSLSLAAIDFTYAGGRRRISPVYLLDGVAELGIAALWGWVSLREARESRSAPEPAFA
jgi:hypothetical protein